MICRKCGRKLPEGQSYCPICIIGDEPKLMRIIDIYGGVCIIPLIVFGLIFMIFTFFLFFLLQF
ncbi:MAG: hypothetical protein ACFFBD_15495 [Candidatus Hodarchaeota archaeon]